jgi:hypothetical protein
MLLIEVIIVYSGSHAKQINTLCGQNVELLNDKAGDIYRTSYHYVQLIKCKKIIIYNFRDMLYECVDWFYVHSMYSAHDYLKTA